MAERWPVIDTHFHIGVNRLITFLAEEELIPWLDRAKTDIQIVFQVNEGFCHETPEWNPWVGNDYIAKIQRMFPARVLGLATVNPWLQAPGTWRYPLPDPKSGKPFDKVTRSPALEELERAIMELGLHGLKMHPLEHNYQFNNPDVVFPVLDKLTQLQRKAGRKMLVVVHAAGESLNNSPEAIADTARNFPELLFIAAHSGFVWGYGTVARSMGPVPNILLDLTTCSQKSLVWESYQRYGATKFSAGTDGPFVGHHIRDAIVNDLVQSEEERQLVLGGNIAKYMGIPKVKT